MICLKFTYRGVQKPKQEKRDHLTCQRWGTAILATETAEEGLVDCIWLPHVLGRFPRKPDMAQQGGALTSSVL